MADSDRASFSPDKLEDALSRLAKQQLYLGESVNAMTMKIDELLQRVSPAFSSTPPTPPPLPPPQPCSQSLDPNPPLSICSYNQT